MRLCLGLCCQFANEPIRFRTTTAAYLTRLQTKGGEPFAYLEEIIRDNILALHASITYCAQYGIGSFRISSRFLPLITHPVFAYSLQKLPVDIHQGLRKCKKLAQNLNIRLTFHPDQFVVLNSPHENVVERSVADLAAQADLAEAIGADVVNVHAGGGYGEKKLALKRFVSNVLKLSKKIRSCLTVENDDKIFTPLDLFPVCQELKIPLVYDVHHHRCHPDGLSVEEATKRALRTWNRKPLFHISSPKEGWNGSQLSRHHDYIDPCDFPACWRELDITIEVEAKAKELAVLKLLCQFPEIHV